MDSRIAEVRRNRVSAVRRVNALEVLRHFVKRFVPLQPLPTVSGATHRIAQPIFIVVQILQGDSFRADVAAAERILLVTANVEMLIPADSYLQAADRLAKIAGAIVDRSFVSGCHGMVAQKFQLLGISRKIFLDSLPSVWFFNTVEFLRCDRASRERWLLKARTRSLIRVWDFSRKLNWSKILDDILDLLNDKQDSR